MIVNGETKSQPIADKARSVSRMYFTFVTEQEEPCEGRLSSTVLWERGGETPLRDPTRCELLGRRDVNFFFPINSKKKDLHTKHTNVTAQ